MDGYLGHHASALPRAFEPANLTLHAGQKYTGAIADEDFKQSPVTHHKSADDAPTGQALVDQLIKEVQDWIAMRKQSAHDLELAISLAKDILVASFGSRDPKWQAWEKVLSQQWQFKRRTTNAGYSIRATAENMNDLQKLQKNIDQMVSCRYRTILSMPLIRDVISADKVYTAAAVAELQDRVRLDVNEHAHLMKLARDEEYAAKIAAAGDDANKLKRVKVVWKKASYVFVPKKAARVDDKRRKRVRAGAEVKYERFVAALSPVDRGEQPRAKRRKVEEGGRIAAGTPLFPESDGIGSGFYEDATPATFPHSSQTDYEHATPAALQLSSHTGYEHATPATLQPASQIDSELQAYFAFPPAMCARCEAAVCANVLLERIQVGEGEYTQATIMGGFWAGQGLGLGEDVDIQAYPIASFGRLGELKDLLSFFAEHVQCKSMANASGALGAVMGEVE